MFSGCCLRQHLSVHFLALPAGATQRYTRPIFILIKVRGASVDRVGTLGFGVVARMEWVVSVSVEKRNFIHLGPQMAQSEVGAPQIPLDDE